MRTTANKIGITVYLEPETYRRIEEARNPRLSKSCFCALVLDEVFSVQTN
jgi:hypothetical protein